MPGMTHSTSIVDPNGATSLVFWEVLNVPARSYEIVVKTSNNTQNPGAKTRLPTPCFWLNMKVCGKMQCSTSCQNARYHQLEVTRPIHASQNCQDPCRCSSSPCARSLKACKKGCIPVIHDMIWNVFLLCFCLRLTCTVLLCWSL